jgi:hypothetical protein
LKNLHTAASSGTMIGIIFVLSFYRANRLPVRTALRSAPSLGLQKIKNCSRICKCTCTRVSDIHKTFLLSDCPFLSRKLTSESSKGKKLAASYLFDGHLTGNTTTSIRQRRLPSKSIPNL